MKGENIEAKKQNKNTNSSNSYSIIKHNNIHKCK